MAKRGNNEGTIYKRADGRWEAAITLPGTTPSGKRQRHSFYGKTRQDAARQLAAALRDLDRGLAVTHDGGQTVRQYFSAWLETVRPTLKESAWVRYEGEVRLHVLPNLGTQRLARLSAQHLQRLYARKLEEGLAPASVAHLHAVIHRALEAAVRLEMLPRNVADLLDVPRPETHEMHPLTQEQAQTLLQAVRGGQLEAMYTLAVHTGMRLGELLALTWRDVDLDAGYLQVRHTLRFAKGGTWTLTPPKTKRSRRRIDLNPTLVRALRRHRTRQLEERLGAGTVWHEHDIVFTRANGEPLRGIHVYQRDFVPLLRRTGLPTIRFHDLRHTAATLLLQELPLKVVSELLGHSSVAITADRYGHVTPSMQKSAAAAMERLFARVTADEGDSAEQGR